MMSDMFIHEIFKIHHRKRPEIHVCLNFSFYDDYERIFRIKNSSIKTRILLVLERVFVLVKLGIGIRKTRYFC